MKVSVIIPCYNEEDIIQKTYEGLVEIINADSIKKMYDYELIFIDDGSKDQTISLIETYSEHDSRVKYISFSRNFGKEAAMLAGLSYCNGDAAIIIDADLQHPPELIPEMIDYYCQGYDQVIAKRSRKGENIARKWISRLYYRIINKVIDVELVDGIGDFRLLSSRAIDALKSLPEYNRFSKGLFSWIGFKEKVIEYENQKRLAGESKWNFRSLLNYGLDGLLSFNNQPLRIVVYFGFIIALISVFYIIYTFSRIMLFGIDVPGYFTTISAILLLSGVQLISIGIIGEYIGRIYYEVKRRPKYIIQQTNLLKENGQFGDLNSRIEMTNLVENSEKFNR